MATSPQGIMALNEPAAAEAPVPPNAPQLTREDFYDISRQALRTARPDLDMEMEELLQAIRNMAESLPEEGLRIFLNIFQSILDHPEDYKEALQALREVAPELAVLLPKEFDEEFYATVAFIFEDALRTRRAPGTASVEGIEAMMPQRFAKGGIAEAARLVASQGRGGDTMLAHITPREAQLLKAFGGSGTINPKTGQLEFFLKWIKKNIIDPVVGAGKAVVKAVTGVVKGAVDLIKTNPVAKAVATVALAYVIGPQSFALFSTKAGAAAAASAAVTAVSGGNLKDIAISSLTAYMGAPGGPIESVVSKYSPAFMNNPLVNAAVSGTIAGTGSGLLQGRSLSDSLRSGLTEGAISAGVTIAANGGISNAMKNASDATLAKTVADATPANPALEPELPQIKQDALRQAAMNVDQVQAVQVAPPPDLTEVVGANAQREIDRAIAQAQGRAAPGVTAAVPDAAVARLTAQELDPGSSAYAGAQATPSLSGTLPPPGTLATYDVSPALSGLDESRRAAVSGLSLGDTTFGDIPPMGMDIAASGAPTGTPAGGIGSLQKVPTVMESLKKIGRGDVLEGAGDLFMPSGPSTKDILSSQEFAQLTASKAQGGAGLSSDAALKVLQESKDYNPGFMRTYGPVTAAGIAGLALSGGFKPQDQPKTEEQQRYEEQMRKSIGETVEEAPKEYLVQNVPGIKYDQEGNIIGTYSPPPAYTIEDVVADQRPATQYSAYQEQAPLPPVFMSPYGEQYLNQGGIAGLRAGGYPRRTGQISGPGTETSDSIPAMLSDGEFVMTARAVRGMGNGSRREGAKRMYALMHKLERNAARG